MFFSKYDNNYNMQAVNQHNVHHEYITHNIKHLLEHNETVTQKMMKRIKKSSGKNRMEENVRQKIDKKRG